VGLDSREGDTNVAADGRQVITSTLTAGRYPDITVQAGVPVKWVIDAPEGSLNGCNYRLIIPEYEIMYEFNEGENVIEFNPEAEGTFPYSCWMGMIQGTISVSS
jgi:plastocyanin domain-containing protein